MKRGQTRAAVLQALADAGTAGRSGAALAADLSVSRSTVCKHVQALRAAGHAIAARPGGGYALAAPPAGVLAGLAPRRLQYRLHHQALVASTMDWARSLAAAGAPEGTLCLADAQSAGRGRRGRHWLSPAGGLYLSLVLRPLALPPAALPRLALVAAVAVARAIGPAAVIKWPNDVLAGGRKVCGILSELAAGGEVVLGIGVNVAAAPELAALATAGSLGAAGRTRRTALLRAILAELDACYDGLLRGGWSELADEWRRRSCTLGRDVRVAGAFGELAGRAVDIDADGALLLTTAAGGRRLLAGEVTLAPTQRAGEASP